MSLFGKGPTGTVEKEQDYSKRTVDTGAYEGIIKMAFVGAAPSGAKFVTLQLKLANGKDYTETVYITNKEGSVTYKKDDKEFFLPGYTLINNLAILTTNRGLFDLEGDVETRTVKLYDYDAKADVATDVPAIIPMIGQKVLVAISEEEYAKTKRNDSTGKYDPTGEYGVKNQLVKAYCPETRKSPVELRDNKDATALDNWVATYGSKLKTVERTAAPANQTSNPTPSGLFG